MDNFTASLQRELADSDFNSRLFRPYTVRVSLAADEHGITGEQVESADGVFGRVRSRRHFYMSDNLVARKFTSDIVSQ